MNQSKNYTAVHLAAAVCTSALSAFAVTRWWCQKPAITGAEIETKAPPQQAERTEAETDKLLDALLIIGKCKRELRTGWVDMKVDLPESIADHMFRVAVLAAVAMPDYDSVQKLDRGKAVQIGLLHDVAEALVGDITPFQGVSKADKSKMESDAIAQIQGLLTTTTTAEVKEGSLASKWNDYEFQRCREAEYIKDFDKLEMILQAFEYEQEAFDKGNTEQLDLERFYTSVHGRLKTETGRSLEQAILRRRTARDLSTTSTHQ
jgi:putative hydrolase of HD superfamily